MSFEGKNLLNIKCVLILYNVCWKHLSFYEELRKTLS